MRSRISALPLALAFSLCAWQVHAQETYRLTKIEGLTSFGDLNNKGVVVGSTVTANGAQHAAVWENGHLTDVHDRIDSNAVFSELRGVNDKSDLVGDFVDPNFQGFILSGRRLTRIGPLPGDNFSVALGLNDRRQVIGGSTAPNGTGKQFVWERGQFTILEGLSGDTNGVAPVEIQHAGLVAGQDNLAQRAVIWQNGTVMDIGGLPGSTRNEVGGINDRGQVAGQSTLSDPDVFPQQVTAFIWEEGAARALPSLFPGMTESRTLGINNRGVVVGFSLPEGAIDDTQTSATVWQDGVAYDLNKLIDPSDPLAGQVMLTDGDAINNRGQIVARTFDPNLVQSEFYLLTPVH